jgi:hypothetical protein
VTQSHKTAIARNKLSAPVTLLRDYGLILGRVLDYGAGKGDIFRFWLRSPDHGEQYDPYWHPVRPKGKFLTVYCGYVLNVLRTNEERMKVIRDAVSYLEPDGVAYFAVRRDVKDFQSTLGARQHVVTPLLPLTVDVKGRFAIYRFINNGERTL